MSSLADIPFLGGYTQQDQMNRAQEGKQLVQAGALQGLLTKMQAAQQEQAFRAKLAQLGPNPSQDALVRLAVQFSPAKDILTSQTASADRKAALEAANIRYQSDREQRAHDLEVRGQQRLDQIEAAAHEGRLTRAEADKHAAATRESMIRLTAALRPPPAVQPLVQIIGDDGTPKWVERQDAVGKVPAGAGSKAENVIAGKKEVDKDVITLKMALDQLKEGGGITSTAKGVIPNVGSYLSNTGVGQVLGSAGGTTNQKARDVIAQSRPLLLRSIMNATGMTARQLDSNAELKLWLSVATDPTKGYEANMEALSNIAEKFGSGSIGEKSGRKTDIKPINAVDEALKKYLPK